MALDTQARQPVAGLDRIRFGRTETKLGTGAPAGTLFLLDAVGDQFQVHARVSGSLHLDHEFDFWRKPHDRGPLGTSPPGWAKFLLDVTANPKRLECTGLGRHVLIGFDRKVYRPPEWTVPDIRRSESPCFLECQGEIPVLPADRSSVRKGQMVYLRATRHLDSLHGEIAIHIEEATWTRPREGANSAGHDDDIAVDLHDPGRRAFTFSIRELPFVTFYVSKRTGGLCAYLSRNEGHDQTHQRYSPHDSPLVVRMIATQIGPERTHVLSLWIVPPR